MHFITDTDVEDAAWERFWPEEFKKILREEFKNTIFRRIRARGSLRRLYQKTYRGLYQSYDDFVISIANGVTIGAENGADKMFRVILLRLLGTKTLPPTCKPSRLLWPLKLKSGLRHRLCRAVSQEYSKEHIFVHFYEDYCTDKKTYPSFNSFLDGLASLIVTGMGNGADEMLTQIYQALLIKCPLPPARRLPRTLRTV